MLSLCKITITASSGRKDNTKPSIDVSLWMAERSGVSRGRHGHSLKDIVDLNYQDRVICSELSTS